MISTPVLAAALGAACAAAPGYVEEAQSRGIDYLTAGLSVINTFGVGVGLVDLDNDGDPDLVAVGSPLLGVHVWENDGTGVFTDRTAASGIPFLDAGSGVVAGDYDNDGDLDLYISRWVKDDVLLRNDGAFVFADATAAAGLAGNNGAGAGCAFGDYDNDGWLDLFVANRTLTLGSSVPNQLFHNLGDGTFVDMASALGVDDGSPSFQGTFVDIDLDTDVDLYVSNDKGSAGFWHNYLFRNDGGTFTDITAESNATVPLDSMGIAVGDFDGNGLPDIYCTNVPVGNALFLAEEGPVFSQAAAEAGVESFAFGWGTAFLDHDLDADLDLLVCNTLGDGPNRLYRNDSPWPCDDIASEVGLGTEDAYYCLAIADIDRDGDLDLLMQRLGGTLQLFVNQSPLPGHWSRLNVVGEPPQHFAVGATIHAVANGVAQFRQIICGNNYKSQNELAVHFGWGAADVVDELTVAWPGGSERTFANMPTNAEWTLWPDARLGDANQDGVLDLTDFQAMLDCLAPGSTLAEGCEVMDFDGDWDVDLDDVALFAKRLSDPPADCDGDGVPDLVEIASGSQSDADADGQPDECGTQPADLDRDGDVDGADLGLLLGNWGQPGVGDLDESGSVDGADLGLLLAAWQN
ncbi:MAG: CRTAC1 family protein [Phycisphaerales bacterium]|nr:CRTAC1 family protein [Phycisphaerales bacterium]